MVILTTHDLYIYIFKVKTTKILPISVTEFIARSCNNNRPIICIGKYVIIIMFIMLYFIIYNNCQVIHKSNMINVMFSFMTIMK